MKHSTATRRTRSCAPSLLLATCAFVPTNIAFADLTTVAAVAVMFQDAESDEATADGTEAATTDAAAANADAAAGADNVEVPVADIDAGEAEDGEAEEDTVQSRVWLGIIIAAVCGMILLYIALARSGATLFIRKISGLEAVDEAVGRATEMGKPCLFVPGILDLNDLQTVAGITVLSRVAELTAEYQTPINVPTARSLVMTTAREAVQASYYTAGRSDAFRPDDIYYLTDEQFGYVASVTGSMVRDKPAACFYMGAFFAESLLLAETGNSVGAIQVAGTAMPSQLPFFVAACDYTLIGEEFFAASAYLSGEPMQLGSLKGQDFGKIIATLLIVVGCFAATMTQFETSDRWAGVLDYLVNHICGTDGFRP